MLAKVDMHNNVRAHTRSLVTSVRVCASIATESDIVRLVAMRDEYGLRSVD